MIYKCVSSRVITTAVIEILYKQYQWKSHVAVGDIDYASANESQWQKYGNQIPQTESMFSRNEDIMKFMQISLGHLIDAGSPGDVNCKVHNRNPIILPLVCNMLCLVLAMI